MTEQSVRVVVCGDGAVGKTALVHSYLRTLLSIDEAIPKKLEVSTMVDDQYVLLSFVDQDTSTVTTSFFPDADVFLVCFSVVQPSSFDNVRAKWIPQIQHNNPGKPFLLVGTKLDLRSNFEIVQRLRSKNHEPTTFDQGRALAIELKAAEYKECSATSLEGLRDVVEDTVRVALGTHKARRARGKGKKSCDLV